MPINATDFGDVSMLRDQPSGTSGSYEKVGGTCIVGTATSAMSPGNAVIIDTSNADSYKTTTSANQTTGAGFVVASMTRGQEWDYDSAITSGSRILIRVTGIVLATASAAISAGALVGTSTTAGAVVTTSTAGAGLGRALQAAAAAASTFRVLISRS